MDFEGDHSNDEEMIPIIPAHVTTEEATNFSNYPHSVSGTKSKLSVEQQAALDDPHEKDILELLQQMDDFDPLVMTNNYNYNNNYYYIFDKFRYPKALPIIT